MRLTKYVFSMPFLLFSIKWKGLEATCMKNDEYLSKQILTYLGNKRLLINDIKLAIEEIQEELGNNKTKNLDLFSGSGIVARMMKEYSSILYANDLENYSKIINECYLSNENEIDKDKLNEYYNEIINYSIKHKKEGVISKHYAPKDDDNILKEERVFYTKENANIIDSIRNAIDKVVKEEEYKKYFLAPLIIEASIHTNTAGVFKGFYKNKNTGIGTFGGTEQNALKRIKGKIELNLPIFSKHTCEYKVFKEDAVILSKEFKDLDIVYMDPPYNQHPYGSNYFMLNVILDNKKSKNISEVSGIPSDWNRSAFNKKIQRLTTLFLSIKALLNIFDEIKNDPDSYDFLDTRIKKEFEDKFNKRKVEQILISTPQEFELTISNVKEYIRVECAKNIEINNEKYKRKMRYMIIV